MDSSISPEIQAEMESLCGRISTDHALGAEILEELRGHMEDKLLSYLSGNEHLTEKDAFILVREHFGEPAVLEELLQRVHGLNSGRGRFLISAIGCINTAFGAVGLLLSLYGTVAGLLIIQNAVRLVGSDKVLGGPYTPVLVNVILLPQSCLMLASGMALLRRKPWGWSWSFVCACYMLVAAPLIQSVAHTGRAAAPGSMATMTITMAYALLIITVMKWSPARRLIHRIN